MLPAARRFAIKAVVRRQPKTGNSCCCWPPRLTFISVGYRGVAQIHSFIDKFSSLYQVQLGVGWHTLGKSGLYSNPFGFKTVREDDDGDWSERFEIQASKFNPDVPISCQTTPSNLHNLFTLICWPLTILGTLKQAFGPHNAQCNNVKPNILPTLFTSCLTF